MTSEGHAFVDMERAGPLMDTKVPGHMVLSTVAVWERAHKAKVKLMTTRQRPDLGPMILELLFLKVEYENEQPEQGEGGGAGAGEVYQGARIQ